MRYKQTTQTPNELFDILLKELSYSELKVLLHIIRKTYGWVKKNGQRKQRDQITYSQFHKSTGISTRAIPNAIQSLILRQYIKVTDYKGNLLHTPSERKGKTRIYYQPLFTCYAKNTQKMCKKRHQPMQNKGYNKTKRTKLNRQKRFSTKRVSDFERIQEILRNH